MSKELFSLGEIYPSDFLAEGQEPTTEKVELKLIMDDDGLVRLEKTAPMNKMYGKYWYRSGINQTMKDALKDVVYSILKLKKSGNWLDIACNDGTLLSYVPVTFVTVGVDPAEDSFKDEAKKHCDFHIQDFFSKEIFKGENPKFDVITSIAMFYDVPNPKKFIQDIYDILDDDGVWVMQLSYSPLMMRQLAFDNICHEHIYYYSMQGIIDLLNANRFMVVDCELNDINGGSFRVYIKKLSPKLRIKDDAYFRIKSLLELEKSTEANSFFAWKEFAKRIESLKAVTTDFINNQKALGKSIWAYGASTKGNTLLQYFGLDNTMIDAIADRNPSKHGLRTIGSNIPIKSEEAMREAQPDYLLILPWHFISEFKERESEYLCKGGKFIVPCPEFKIITV